MSNSKTFILVGIICFAVSVSNADVILTLNGDDITDSIVMRDYPGALTVAVDGNTPVGPNDISIEAQNGTLMPHEPSGSYYFQFTSEGEATINLITKTGLIIDGRSIPADTLIYQLWFCYNADCNIYAGFGIGLVQLLPQEEGGEGDSGEPQSPGMESTEQEFVPEDSPDETPVDFLSGAIVGEVTADMEDLEESADYQLEGYEYKSADFNLDKIVDFLDFAELANAFLSDVNDANWNSEYDLDNSDFIDIYDIELFSYQWLQITREPNEVFAAFKDALEAGDIDTALTFVAESSKDRYAEIFQAIDSNLPNFAAGMGTIVLESQDGGRAVYEMTHQDGSTTYSFPVVFIRDDDGSWKIYNF